MKIIQGWQFQLSLYCRCWDSNSGPTDLIKAINLKVIEKIYLSSNHASVLLNTIREILKKISADDIDRLLTPREEL